MMEEGTAVLPEALDLVFSKITVAGLDGGA